MTRLPLALALLSLLCGNAGAQNLCGPRDVLLQAHLDKFQEVPVAALMLGKDGSQIAEILLSPERTWTILVTNTNGLTCIVMGGYDWPDFKVPAPEKDS